MNSKGGVQFIFWGENHFRIEIPKNITKNVQDKLSLGGFKRIEGKKSEYILKNRNVHVEIDEINGKILLFSSWDNFKLFYNIISKI